MIQEWLRWRCKLQTSNIWFKCGSDRRCKLQLPYAWCLGMIAKLTSNFWLQMQMLRLQIYINCRHQTSDSSVIQIADLCKLQTSDLWFKCGSVCGCKLQTSNFWFQCGSDCRCKLQTSNLWFKCGSDWDGNWSCFMVLGAHCNNNVKLLIQMWLRLQICVDCSDQHPSWAELSMRFEPWATAPVTPETVLCLLLVMQSWFTLLQMVRSCGTRARCMLGTTTWCLPTCGNCPKWKRNWWTAAWTRTCQRCSSPSASWSTSTPSTPSSSSGGSPTTSPRPCLSTMSRFVCLHVWGS